MCYASSERHGALIVVFSPNFANVPVELPCFVGIKIVPRADAEFVNGRPSRVKGEVEQVSSDLEVIPTSAKNRQPCHK